MARVYSNMGCLTALLIQLCALAAFGHAFHVSTSHGNLSFNNILEKKNMQSLVNN